MTTKAKNFAEQLKEVTGYISHFINDLIEGGHKFTAEQVSLMTAREVARNGKPQDVLQGIVYNGQVDLISQEALI